MNKLREYHAAPPLQGFGISEPAQVRDALQAGAAGAISGSAIVKIIEQNQANPTEMLTKLANFTREMKAATRA
ncbi:Tryptophan synthase alpha chain [compost metagenome]